MKLTFDMYSGATNPSWELPSAVAQKVIEIAADFGLFKSLALAGPAINLGYRGLRLDVPSEFLTKYRLTPTLNLSASMQGHLGLIEGLASVLRFFPFPGIEEFRRLAGIVVDQLRAPPQSAPASAGVQAGPCAFEMLPYEPNLWNDPAFKPTNNCYAYASNKRAAYPSKPQPGIGSGKQYGACTSAEVSAAAKRDGAHDVDDCFPDSEAPRLLVALVIWPGQDYHWYRKHPNFWGHKPGSTDARNVDNANKIITDPQACDRGPYTEFYGYMLIPKSQKVAAK
jgi:hypothetical protein